MFKFNNFLFNIFCMLHSWEISAILMSASGEEVICYQPELASTKAITRQSNPLGNLILLQLSHCSVLDFTCNLQNFTFFLFQLLLISLRLFSSTFLFLEDRYQQMELHKNEIFSFFFFLQILLWFSNFKFFFKLFKALNFHFSFC